VRRRLADVAAPVAVGVLALWAWSTFVRVRGIEPYVLPSPGLVAQSLREDAGLLLRSLLFTLRIAGMALAAAAVVGGALAVLLAQSRWAAASLYPWIVALQVTPIVAIAPLIILWTGENTTLALLTCAFVVAFFPVVSNTTLGLRSVEPDLVDLFRLYGASRAQVLLRLQAPAALPYFLAGLRISGGLALIGAVVAEFVAGTGGAETGLAWRILESSYRLQVPRMFAALVVLALAGVGIFGLLSLATHLLLRTWHPSARARAHEGPG
jgi:NitT/TauT family transport system permease protein